MGAGHSFCLHAPLRLWGQWDWGWTGRGGEGVRGEGTVDHAQGEGTALLLTTHGLPSGGRRWVWPSMMWPSLPQGPRDPVCLGVNLTQNIGFSTRSQVPASGRRMLRSKFQGILPHPADPGCFPASPHWQPGSLITLRQELSGTWCRSHVHGLRHQENLASCPESSPY